MHVPIGIYIFYMLSSIQSWKCKCFNTPLLYNMLYETMYIEFEWTFSDSSTLFAICIIIPYNIKFHSSTSYNIIATWHIVFWCLNSSIYYHDLVKAYSSISCMHSPRVYSSRWDYSPKIFQLSIIPNIESQ